MNYQVWESTDNSGEFETMRKVQKRMIMIAASFRLSWDWKSIIGMRDTSWRDDGTPHNMGCRVNKHDTFHRSILEIKCPLVFTKFIYIVSWRKHAYTRRLLFIPSTTEAFFFHHTDMSTSEQNLSDEFEGELPAEEKPRLTFTQDVPPAIHYGHKLDMTDRDPVKMNDHVKVQK